MTLRVQDDDGSLVDANSYAEAADMVDYFAEIGVDYSTNTIEVNEAAMVKAFRYIESRWGDMFIGLRLTSEQNSSWPRSFIQRSMKYEGIASEVIRAQYEYASFILDGNSLQGTTNLTPGQVVQSIRSKVGPIDEQVTYSSAYLDATTVPVPAADNLLATLIRSTGSVIR